MGDMKPAGVILDSGFNPCNRLILFDLIGGGLHETAIHSVAVPEQVPSESYLWLR
jgi:hypothetical protein